MLGGVAVVGGLDGGAGSGSLGALVAVLAGSVCAVAALFGIGYAHGAAASRTGWTAFVVFQLGLQLVPAANDPVVFLLAWELMAVGSAVLVLADHAHRPEVRSAGLWYAVMTQLSYLLLVAGFAVLATANGGSFDLQTLRPPAPGASGAAPGRGAPPPRVWPSCCSPSASPPRAAWCRCTSGCRAPTRRLPATSRP